MVFRTLSPLACLAALGTLACLAPLPPAAAEELVSFEQVPLVANPASPAGGTLRMELQELWRAGGEEDEHFFGVIGDCQRDAAGRIYLLDRQLSEVCVYAPDGRRLRTLSGPGEGPGEVSRPEDLLFLPDGTLGIVHRTPGEIVRLALDGTPLSSYQLLDPQGEPLGAVRVQQAKPAGDRLVLCGQRRRQSEFLNDHEQFLSIFSPAGTEVRKLMSHTERAFNFEERTFTERYNYFANTSGWTTDGEGRIYVAPERDQYLIHIYAPDGSALRAIGREFIAPERTPEEKERIESGLSMTFNGERLRIEAEIEPRHQAIHRLWVDEAGYLWVHHSRSDRDLPEGVFATYDRFDPNGVYIQRVEIFCPGDPQQDQLYCLNANRFVLLRGMAGALQAFWGRGADQEAAAGADVQPLEVVCLQRR